MKKAAVTARLCIHQWSADDRPREKMLAKGAESLSNAELIAILIGSGNREENAVELARRMLQNCKNDLNELASWRQQQFGTFKGMGEAKAVSVMAALELGRRRSLQVVAEQPEMRCSADLYQAFHAKMGDAEREEFWLAVLNNRLKVMAMECISIGGIDATHVDVRVVLKEALLRNATHIAVAHNHPAGTPRPSREDVLLTERLSAASEAVSIKLLDHVIVCRDTYYSFADEGQL